MNSPLDDDSDPLFDALRESLAGSDEGPLLPGPDALPPSASGPGPSWTMALLLVVVAVVVGIVVIGRADVWMMRLGAIAIVIGVVPALVGRRAKAPLTLDVTARISLEAAALAERSRSWKRSAWALAGPVLAAGLATGYTHDAYADSPAADLREIPLRWLGLVVCFTLAAGLLFVEHRRAAAARREATELIAELELDAATESIRNPWAALSITLFVAVASAFVVPRILAPTNLDDSPARVLVLGPQASSHARWLRTRFGLDAHAKTVDEAWSAAEERFGGDRDQLETLTHLADLEGFGFVLVDLDALPAPLEPRPDLELASPVPSAPTFAALATGDIVALEQTVWSGRGRSRPEWVPLGAAPATYGAAEPWIEGPAAEHLGAARALFAQPAFREPKDQHPGTNQLPPLSSRNTTLIRGVMFFDLPDSFWADALDTYQDIESITAKRRVPPQLRLGP
ncbi:MAG: hypothetical protein AAF799_05480 [Myxococcota bacterium]